MSMSRCKLIYILSYHMRLILNDLRILNCCLLAMDALTNELENVIWNTTSRTVVMEFVEMHWEMMSPDHHAAVRLAKHGDPDVSSVQDLELLNIN